MEEEQRLEQARVDRVDDEIKRQIETTAQAVNDAHKETRAVEKNYSENASINRYEVDDIAESRSELEQQRRLVSQAAENETILKHQLQTLRGLHGSPYFGRIDILDPGEKEPETLYIGTASLMNEDKTDFLIYDWRAPISGVYYNGNLGPVKYETPAGIQKTELVKKRQFTIKDGKITNMFDTNDTVGDELLQAALGEQNDQYMHNIVATIQQEQNDIIRDTKSDLLLVQGVAGSGKTSAILQRIAYLLYHSRAELNADQIVLFSPNNLFSHYISEVLPSLGERNMRQVTLAGFLRRRFEGLQVETLFDRYEDRQTGNGNHDIADFLESAAAMDAVRDYVRDLPVDQFQFADLTFNSQVFFSAAHIKEIYQSLPATMTAADRLIHLKNKLIRELQHRVREEAKKDWVAKGLDELDVQQLHSLYGKHTVDDFEDEDQQYDYLSRRYAKRRLRVVADAIYNNYFIDFFNQYEQFLRQVDLPQNISKRDWTSSITEYQEEIECHRLKLMHTAPLMYLRDLMTGSGQNQSFQYVFIDEMQDYPLAMLVYLRHTFPRAKFTVLGDSEQALFKPLQLPQEMLEELSAVLKAKHPNLISLNRSYRSTKEITDFAKSLLPDGDQVISFTRHGDQPRLVVRYDQPALNEALLESINDQRTEYETVAVLTKNLAQAEDVYRFLHQQKVDDLHLLHARDSALPSGVLVLPIYLAKGLEFDSVVAYDVSASNMENVDAVGMIYTMATRAMHQLTLLSNGPVSPAINEQAGRQLVIEHELMDKD
ncbi:RNA polymerase recycling motor HelD [Limosilactobacillus viscerum]|uniref:RNA polymerase recycling motor HelD n=1 Tax=Limosilactobacillus viscerum TaxID=2993450 RepID=UPI0024BBB835|nr:RNA polymerase recycling motor HelD [Limosilactobacillus viscerum]